jgi:hypothetical protein
MFYIGERARVSEACNFARRASNLPAIWLIYASSTMQLSGTAQSALVFTRYK